MQISSGQSVKYTSDEKDLRRGDLVFWPGHAGILLESQTIIHANATEMRVTMAPLDDLVAKIEESTGDKIIAVRRV
jgi:cell wall-associated NlpC family hydrolase